MESVQEAWRIDSIVEAADELHTYFMEVVGGYKESEISEEKRQEMFTNMVTSYLPAWLTAIERRLLGNSTNFNKDLHGMYIVGEKMTIADIAMANVIFSIFYNEGAKQHDTLRRIYETFPTLHRYADTLRVRFLDYLDVRPKNLPF